MITISPLVLLGISAEKNSMATRSGASPAGPPMGSPRSRALFACEAPGYAARISPTTSPMIKMLFPFILPSPFSCLDRFRILAHPFPIHVQRDCLQCRRHSQQGRPAKPGSKTETTIEERWGNIPEERGDFPKSREQNRRKKKTESPMAKSQRIPGRSPLETRQWGRCRPRVCQGEKNSIPPLRAAMKNM